ncbi:MAG: aspartate aminotransferase family protein [Planctomycetes bacterium]|nr:aspartate aminotransferase family protein [Planctomycetota bacterium]
MSPAQSAKPASHAKSAELFARAQKVLAGGVSSEFRKASVPHPLFYEHGQGARITDVDGNEYLDFTLSQGPLILGHSHPEVLATVAEHSARGQLFAGQHLAELELAETLQRLIPCAELMRFSLSGSESDHCAWRLARAITGRPRILRFEGHYHGWFDPVAQAISGSDEAALGPRAAPTPVPWTKGLPPRIQDEIVTLPWNDLALVEQTLAARGSEIAAITTEPVMCNNGCIEPAPGYLAGLRALCDRYGCLLIFDEVITGFRMGLGGAQKRYGVTPDLAIFGKAMASGYPISVLCGTRTAMDLITRGEVIHAGTMNSGNPSVAAAIATIAVLERERVPERLERLGQRLAAGLRAAATETGKPLLVQGPGAMLHCGFTALSAVRDLRGCISYDKGRYAAFLRGMHERGIRLIGRGLWYISNAHSEADIDRAIATAREVLRGV